MYMFQIEKRVIIDIDEEDVIKRENLHKGATDEEIDEAVQDYVNGMDDLEYNLINEVDKANICLLVKRKLAE